MQRLSVTLVRPSTSATKVRGTTAAPAAGYGWLGIGLLGLGVGLAVLSALGPLLLGVIDYRVTETYRNETIGLDAVSLALVAPAAIAVGVLALRRHASAPVLALGPAAYSAYMLVQYVLGPQYLRLPGNNERFFPLYLALFVLASAIGIRAWNSIDRGRLPALDARRARLLGRFVLPLVAVAVFARYIPALLDATSRKPTAADYSAGPTFFWTIALLDIGIGLPTLVVACFGLLHGRAWAPKALWIVVAWLALVVPAVAGMATAMYINDDPNASLSLLAIMGGLAIGLVALAVFVFRPLFTARAALAGTQLPRSLSRR
jgi:hypothetical protein